MRNTFPYDWPDAGFFQAGECILIALPIVWLRVLGNCDSFTGETREHNAANELETISGSTIDPLYDAAGNMTSGPVPGAPAVRQHYRYDAWNRLVAVSDDNAGSPGTVIATFEYDGRNYRIQKTAGGVVEAFFYNENSQVLEQRDDGVVAEQYVWDLLYIDAPVLRETASGVLYYTNDANFNVTGLVDEATGDVVERYHYDPYGKATYYDGTWAALAVQESAQENDYLYTGRRLDPETGLMYYRARYYDVALGRFISRDPIGYAAGDVNVYAYVRSSPTNATDPSGLIPNPIGIWWNMDWAGEEILDHWLDGTGTTVTHFEGPWGSYMRDNELLPIQLARHLLKDAMGRSPSSSRAVDLVFQAEIENGYSTGYQMLHGTHARVGGFTIAGGAKVSKDSQGRKLVHYDVKFTWNDRIDPNPKYKNDIKFVEWIEWLGYEPQDYNIHIGWCDKPRLIVDCKGSVLSASGYPFDRLTPQELTNLGIHPPIEERGR